MGFSRQEYWSGLPCPPPGHLPDPGMEPILRLLHWQAGSLPLAPPGNEPWANNFLSFPFFCTVICLEYGMRSQRLLQFPVASVTNYHQLGGLKQHRLSLLLFWRSEV